MAKSNLLRLRRGLLEFRNGPKASLVRSEEAGGPLIAESRSLLYASNAGVEFALQAGKVQNLRVAARYLDGRVLRSGELFSFWAHVPRPSLSRGFALGRELRSGCVIPSVGGGLCQLSNALFGVALDAGWVIVERHAHTRSVPGSIVERGRDATLFWNYVDLRFRPKEDCRLSVYLTQSELRVELRSIEAARFPIVSLAPAVALNESGSVAEAESCETCGVSSCFRHPSASGLVQQGSTAWLVDAWMPEHDAYMSGDRQAPDVLLTPLDRGRWRVGPYRWTGKGFADVRSAPLFVVWRSLVSRRLSAQGASRQRELLRMDAALAAIYAHRIPATALHVVVSQNLLPHLWRSGALAGRSFDVLMTRLPLVELEAQLDRAAGRWPETPTLRDFRVDSELVVAETEALAEARHWITPHTEIAKLGGERSVLLEWQRGPVRVKGAGGRLVFPASTLSRKGARELREAVDGLGVEISLAGAVIEDAEFWRGCEVRRTEGDWLAEAAIVVLPAWVEHQPRRLLAALSAGVPVICTRSCGLPPQAGLTIVPEGDCVALRAAISSFIPDRLSGPFTREISQ